MQVFGRVEAFAPEGEVTGNLQLHAPSIDRSSDRIRIGRINLGQFVVVEIERALILNKTRRDQLYKDPMKNQQNY